MVKLVFKKWELILAEFPLCVVENEIFDQTIIWYAWISLSSSSAWKIKTLTAGFSENIRILQYKIREISILK